VSADYIERSPLYRKTTALLAVDPGINGTGWALWKSLPRDGKPTTAPDHVGVLQKRHGSYVETANWITDELYVVTGIARWMCAVHRSCVCGCGPQPSIRVTCEFPEFQTSASRSMGWMRGDLQKLTYLVGCIGHMTYMLTTKNTGSMFEPVPVSQWKGQLPKAVVESRIRDSLGATACNRLGIKTHAWDAVGIGLRRLEVFK
jgi:hypothetical protein